MFSCLTRIHRKHYSQGCPGFEPCSAHFRRGKGDAFTGVSKTMCQYYSQPGRSLPRGPLSYPMSKMKDCHENKQQQQQLSPWRLARLGGGGVPAIKHVHPTICGSNGGTPRNTYPPLQLAGICSCRALGSGHIVVRLNLSQYSRHHMCHGHVPRSNLLRPK